MSEYEAVYHCSGEGCEETTHLSRDNAYAKGWRIHWVAGGPSWCPKCFRVPMKREKVPPPLPGETPLF